MPDTVRLHPDISFCRVSGTFVFLDARGDRYFCLKGKQANWFDDIISIQHRAGSTPERAAFLAHLIRTSVLTRSPAPGRVLAPCGHRPADRSLLDTGGAHAKGSVVRFLVSWLACVPMRRTRRIQAMLEDVRRRKKQITSERPAEDVLPLTRRFHALALYFVTRHDACLLRSYLLLRYLVSAGVKADWVFGVRLSPFSAHCWVEYEGCVLNEHLETVHEFQPILCA
ncbi:MULTISPECIES: lasso peptide biosynthesis B2 protein [Hyphomonas]|nr:MULTISPECIES: lasso peptide biosynthesis B2 protein [Hyphomonas]